MAQEQSRTQFKDIEQVRYIQLFTGLLLIASWLFLPLLLWLTAVCVFSLSFKYSTKDNLLFFLIAFSLSFLISSRYIGYLWGGADDMPSYLMAYQRYDVFSQMLPVSLIYAKHADFVFGLYSWGIASLSGNHAFFYYFTTLFITYLMIWKFCKLVSSPSPLLCFLLIVIFYKFFQGQWHLIRAYLALPILLCAVWYARDHFKKGLSLFVFGGMIHISTFMLLLPLMFMGRHIDKKWSLPQIFFMFIVFVLAVVGLIFSAKIIGSISGHYIISKIVTRLEFSPSFAKLPTFMFFLIVNVVAIPGYLRTKNLSFIRLFNVTSFFSAVNIVALFVMGDELHRVLLPLYLLYAPLLLFSIRYFEPRLPALFVIALLLVFHMLAFSYVVWLNESNFLYMINDKDNPVEYLGIDYLFGFWDYLMSDIQYYDGYRKG
jgi:hypothetical protein